MNNKNILVTIIKYTITLKTPSLESPKSTSLSAIITAAGVSISVATNAFRIFTDSSNVNLTPSAKLKSGETTLTDNSTVVWGSFSALNAIALTSVPVKSLPD